MITLTDVMNVVRTKMPFDKGKMYLDGTRFQEQSDKIVVDYDVGTVPYIWFQEKGFTHYLSNQFIDVNQFFIENDTVNALTSLINMSPEEQSFITATNSRKIQGRNNQISQGVLESIKGGGDDVYVG